MNKITFEDLPSTNTPINAENLNLMQDNIESAINENTNAINNVDTKANKNADELDSVKEKLEYEWKDLPLADGIEQYTTASQYSCKYMKQGNRVTIIGCVKGISAANTLIAQLPKEYRPINTFRYVTGHNVTYSDIFAISTDGKLTFVGTINGSGTLSNTDFHYIQVEYYTA